MSEPAACDLSILIPCNSRPGHLNLVLAGIAQLALPSADFRGEVLVRHTGPDTAIGATVRGWQARAPFAAGGAWRLLYDPEPVDDGNRSANRNAAIQKSTGRRLVFLDADCIPTRDFLTGHWTLLTPGGFVCGDALRLSESFSAALSAERVAVEDPRRWITADLAADQRQRLARVGRHLRAPQMHKIPLQGGNFACWREDMLAINGFDRHYAGWGQEDTDIGTRLFLLGRTPVNGVGQATCLHIWHPPVDRPAQWKEGSNVGYFLRPGRMLRCRFGLEERAPGDIWYTIETSPRSAAAGARTALEAVLKAAGFAATADRWHADWLFYLADRPTAPKTTPQQIGLGLSAAPPGLLQRWLGGGLKGAAWWFVAGADPAVTRAKAPVQLATQVDGCTAAIGSEAWAAALTTWLRTVG